MNAVAMNDKTEKIRLVLMVPGATRRSLKARAAEEGLEMSELAQIILDHSLGQMADDETPKDLRKAITDYVARRPAKGSGSD